MRTIAPPDHREVSEKSEYPVPTEMMRTYYFFIYSLARIVE